MLVHNLRCSRVKFKFKTASQYMEGKKRPEEEADHARRIDGGLTKQENLGTCKTCPGHCKISRSPYSVTRIFTVLEMIHSSSPGDFKRHCSLKAVSLKRIPLNDRLNVYFKDRWGGEELVFPKIASYQVNCWSHLQQNHILNTKTQLL